MKYFFDMTSLEEINFLQMVSLGMVSDDGRELLLINKNFNRELFFSNKWYVDNYLPSMPINKIDWDKDWGIENFVENYESPGWCHELDLAEKILDFVGDYKEIEFWGTSCQFDWVCLCWILGHWRDWPQYLPTRCNDVDQLGEIREPKGIYTTLDGAKQVKEEYYRLHYDRYL